ncbi:MAG: DUF1015 domain-containing protein [Actinomycetota bacterium]|jgi:uncharacterized protein (DUF1015 family)|nr:DUF1015 domain-containing protein [Actinomycetota bacterium]
MPSFDPFRGVRYHLDNGTLAEVVSPPYDVVSAAEREVLARRHPANSVHIELPEPDLSAGVDRYVAASKLLDDWMASGLLTSDPVPSFYPYRMTMPDGRSTTGVVGSLALDAREPSGHSGAVQPTEVLPHEDTMPKPRSDRLNLLRATKTNLSPIWGLSPAVGLAALLGSPKDPFADIVDDEGVRHQMWTLTAPDAIEEVRDLITGAPLILADGHHRYETAHAYRSEVRARNGDHAGDHDSVMALVVELADNQVLVGPIHRVLAGLPPGFDIVEHFRVHFDLVYAGATSSNTAGALVDTPSLALLTRENAWLLSALPQTLSAARSDLDSSLVQTVIDKLPDHTITYPHDWRDAYRSVTDGTAQAAILLRSVRVAQIAEWATARRRMPPKSTYFYPKPRTGLVFRRLQH